MGTTSLTRLSLDSRFLLGNLPGLHAKEDCQRTVVNAVLARHEPPFSTKNRNNCMFSRSEVDLNFG